MNGVTMLRLKLRPIAECQHIGCFWAFSAGRAQTIRSNAEHHVLGTGHIVNVTIRDITEYAPEPEEVAAS